VICDRVQGPSIVLPHVRCPLTLCRQGHNPGFPFWHLQAPYYTTRKPAVNDYFAVEGPERHSAVGGDGADYGVLIKSYAEEDRRLVLTGARPKPISGRPNPWHISTSYADRNNLNCRTFMRRLTRLTNAFSKRVENLVAALWLYFCHYNFVRIHGSLRVTPAMAAGVTDHICSIEEMLSMGSTV